LSDRNTLQNRLGHCSSLEKRRSETFRCRLLLFTARVGPRGALKKSFFNLQL